MTKATEEEPQTEAPVVKRVMMQASRIKARLLRNGKGKFFNPDLTHSLINAVKSGNINKAKTLAITLEKRRIDAGLIGAGSSDLIGMVTITITPDMTGMEIGVPLVVEVKKPGWEESKEKLNEHEKTQENFIYQVNRRGGIGFFLDDHAKLEQKIAERLKIMVDTNIQRVKSLFDKVGQDQL